jgi:hypothetical protein
MTDLETLALSKAIAAKLAKSARPSILHGTYEIDILSRTTGGMKVGADNPAAKKAGALPAKALVTFLFSKMNEATRNAAIRDYQAWMKTGGEESLGKDIKDAVKACWKPLMEATRGFKAGTVTTTLHTEVLEAVLVEHVVPVEEPEPETAEA